MICRLSVVAFTGTWLALVNLAPAQSNVSSEQYGRGVHAYFAGDNAGAIEALSAAVDGGSKDPRVYYFRALAQLRGGNQAAAEADLAAGAELEIADSNGFYPISRSLERVQGQQRLTLEKYRAKARAAQLQRKQERTRRRYEQLKRAEEDVLRKIPLGPGTPADEPADSAAPAEVAPTPPAAGDDVDLFSDDPKPKTKASARPKAEDDPFGDAAEEPAADQADPFGDDAAGAMPAEADNPFEDAAAPAPKPNKAPPAGGGLFEALGRAVGRVAGDSMPKMPNVGVPTPFGPIGGPPSGGPPPAGGLRKLPPPKLGDPAPKPNADDDSPFGFDDAAAPGDEMPEEGAPKDSPKKPASADEDPFAS